MRDEELTGLLRLGGGGETRPVPGCLDDADVAALLDDGLEPRAAAGVRAHLADCPACRARVGLLARLDDGDLPPVPSELTAPVRRPAERSESPGGGPVARPRRRWRWPSAAAAAAALAVVALTLGRGGIMQTQQQTESDVRSLDLLERPRLLAPVEGEVLSPARLGGLEVRWTPVPGAVQYDVRLVTADGVRIWDGRADGERVRLPSGLLASSGDELYLWVRAVLPGGKSLQSEIVGFRLENGGAPGE